MDIDIDTQMGFEPKEIFPKWTKASMIQNNQLKKHPVGVYPQNIPIDPVTKLSAIPYKDAENNGYFKIDFLHLKVYEYFDSKEEIDELLKLDPPWELLKSPNVCKQLFQLNNPKHYSTIQTISPKSVEDLADVIAIIRPGKTWLLNTYNKNKQYVREKLFEQVEDNYAYKKSHAVAYALVVVLQLHLISMGIEFNLN